MTWQQLLQQISTTKDSIDLMAKVETAYQEGVCYPKKENIFRALDLCPFQELKVVILGQDPYHGANQADGLCFSVPNGVKTPPSLRNIFGEIYQDLAQTRLNTDLSDWAKQGVLLLNSILTVEANLAASHQKMGWENITNQIIQSIYNEKTFVVFVLWGAFAQKKIEWIDTKKHLVLQSAHPSPLSAYRGFFGSKVFSTINRHLSENNLQSIHWVEQ